MGPTDRAANLRRANVMAGSGRRARRRTLFAPTGGPQGEVAVEGEVAPCATDGVALEVATPDGRLDHMSDLALEEFVIDDDDYPEVSAAARRVAPAGSGPDRVDDIDQWLEEFAVSDSLGALPH